MAQDTNDVGVVYFGDSLSDDGTMHDLTEVTLNTAVPPAAYGYAERFTNGEVWTEIEARLLGASVYQNYAVGGAEALGQKTLGSYLVERGLGGDIKDDSLLGFDINLSAQIGRFLADNAGEDLSSMTASIMIGSNDYLNFRPQSADPQQVLLQASALIQDVVNATVTSAMTLLQAGVGEVAISTLPVAAYFPIVETLPPDFQWLPALAFEQHNAALEAAVGQLKAAGLNAEIVDIAALSAEILADPGTFGFIAPLGDSVLVDMGGNSGTAGYDADQVAFFDEVHPTEAGQGVTAAFHAESLTSNVIITAGADDVIQGSRGRDLVLASDGDDAVNLSGGADVALGGLGADTIQGNRGRDLISGGSGNDDLSGGRGADVLAGGAGDDTVLGGRGADILIDGLGSDMMRGGRGDDIFLFTEATLIGGGSLSGDCDIFRGGRGADTLFLALSGETRDAVETSLGEGDAMAGVLAGLGITARGIEEVVFVDDRGELADVVDTALLQEADLWGFV